MPPCLRYMFGHANVSWFPGTRCDIKQPNIEWRMAWVDASSGRDTIIMTTNECYCYHIPTQYICGCRTGNIVNLHRWIYTLLCFSKHGHSLNLVVSPSVTEPHHNPVRTQTQFGWIVCLFVCVLLAGSTTTQPRNVFHRCKHIIVGCIGWSARAHNILFCSGTIAPSAEHASTNPHMGCRVVAFFFGKCARSFPHSLTSMCKTHRENMLFVCVWTDHCSWVLHWLMCCSTQIYTYIARVRLPWLRIDWTTTYHNTST